MNRFLVFGANPEQPSWQPSCYAECPDQQTADRMAEAARRQGWEGVEVEEIVEVIED